MTLSTFKQYRGKGRKELQAILTVSNLLSQALTKASDSLALALQASPTWSDVTWASFLIETAKDNFWRHILGLQFQCKGRGPVIETRDASTDLRRALSVVEFNPIDVAANDYDLLSKYVFYDAASNMLKAFRARLARSSYATMVKLMRSLMPRFSLGRRSAAELVRAVLGVRGSATIIASASAGERRVMGCFFQACGCPIPAWARADYLVESSRTCDQIAQLAFKDAARNEPPRAVRGRLPARELCQSPLFRPVGPLGLVEVFVGQGGQLARRDRAHGCASAHYDVCPRIHRFQVSSCCTTVSTAPTRPYHVRPRALQHQRSKIARNCTCVQKLHLGANLHQKFAPQIALQLHRATYQQCAISGGSLPPWTPILHGGQCNTALRMTRASNSSGRSRGRRFGGEAQSPSVRRRFARPRVPHHRGPTLPRFSQYNVNWACTVPCQSIAGPCVPRMDHKVM